MYKRQEKWEIKEEKENFTLSRGEINIPITLESPTTPEVVDVREQGNFQLVIINHGDIGTSCLVRIHKAYVFNKRDSSFLGAYPFKYLTFGYYNKSCRTNDVNWEYYKNKILINDLEASQKYQISL